MKKEVLLMVLALTTPAQADERSLVIETHNGVTYAYSRDDDRLEWTAETRNGITYVHPGPRPLGQGKAELR
jgi:hypothetical protein